MPRTAFPLTPASSTDITGQDGTKHLPQLQLAFELPPAAMNPRPAAGFSGGGGGGGGGAAHKMHTPDSPVSQTTSPSSPPRRTPYPVQPSESVKSRKRPSAAGAATNKDDGNFTLPPPPTRSRKIIQMRPRTQDERKTAGKLAPGGKGHPACSTNKKGSSAAAATPSTMADGGGGAAPGPARKKQQTSSSGTSAAGRKVARKTAHSLIERRRRSKMNEEFSVLKDMVPACTGEMHKLAILQASIDYVRYLQDCIEKLKAQKREEASQTPGTDTSGAPTPSGREREREPTNGDTGRPYRQVYPDDDEEEQYPPDVEMTGSDAATSPATLTTHPSTPANTVYHHHHHQHYQQQPSVSPVLLAQDTVHRQDSSYSSASTTSASVSRSGSTLTSPALGPLGERDLDQEATAALLMLNIDRRGTVAAGGGSRSSVSGGGGGTGRGMSVRDLLSA
ncbi:hypothetical protein VMCG_00983 [Cytospora schulzeri]|uniref:BHLH domain-containing protein n=1 Tax=Cytospora schulzeri TaxID=448051 RepID=A0A423X6K4_9PEZI|nr:hypothetical protein VMCG_00983 [Valsa malicola]